MFKKSSEIFLGFLCGLYLLSGRWNLYRLYEDAPMTSSWEEVFFEVRFWVLLATIMTVIVGPGKRDLSGILKTPCSKEINSGLLYWVCSFFLLTTASVTWSPDVDMAIPKAVETCMQLIIVLALYSARNTIDFSLVLHSFLNSLFIIGVVFVLILIQKGVGDEARVAVLGGGPNVFGRNMAIFFWTGQYFSNSGPHRSYAKVIGLVFGSFMILSGSRGALFAFAISCLVNFLLSPKKWIRMIMVTIITASVLGIFLAETRFINKVSFVLEQRFLKKTIEERYDSSRSELIDAAVQLAKKKPFLGCGLNSFGSSGLTDQPYPHNIFVEVLVDTGIAGVIILSVILIFFLISSGKLWNMVPQEAWSVFVVSLVHAQFSGDLYDSRGIFLLISLIALSIHSQYARGGTFEFISRIRGKLMDQRGAG